LVELHISCQHLVNLDVMSKSDPIVAVYENEGGRWIERGRTEWIKDNLNPKFVTPVRMQYHFERVQTLRFGVYDIDSLHTPLEQQEFIGEVSTTMAEIFTNHGGSWSAQLKAPGHGSKPRGSLLVTAEEIHEMNQEITLAFEGQKLDKKDFFGKSDPFLVINQVQSGERLVPVVKTEVIKNTLNPVWKPLTIKAQQLCNGDLDRPLAIECYDWNKSGNNELIGVARTTARQLAMPEDRRPIMELVHPGKKGKKGYANSGVILARNVVLKKLPCFTEFLAGGLEISLITAIDFTASNGNPQLATSLHYNNPMQPNSYVQAISAIGEILSYYDSDKMFPVYGFGAQIPPTMSVSHCFALNGNPSNPEVPGVGGIIQAYQRTLTSVVLYGPTMFSQILQAANFIATNASVSQRTQKYFILLIITDGVINDMDATIDQIVLAANGLPLSIVIVGVGSADFKNMEVLDADDCPLRARDGTFASRDIVQFVPFERFRGLPYQHLAQQTLAEIPGQVLSYFMMRGITPNPPKVVVQAAPPPGTVLPPAPPAVASSASSALPPEVVDPPPTAPPAPK
jgi:hypothetical protein